MHGNFKLTWRVSQFIWMDDERYNELLKLLTRKEDVADEFALCITEPSSGGYHPLEEVKRLAGVFKVRAKELRLAGKSVGINVWPSFGSGESYSAAEMRPEMPFRHMTGMDGTVDKGLACPVSAEFLEYIHQKYVILSKAEPDFIWVDDDTRFTDLGGAPYPCFCDECVKNFENGRYKTREELVDALNQEENNVLRHSWSAYGGDRLARFCREVRAAIDEVDPEIDGAFMTVGPTHTTFSGDFINKCMTELRSRRGRPGHGFYWETKPEGMLEKCMEAGRQIVDFPESVEDILYEEESCPGTRLEKSFKTRRNEVSLALAAGCTGVAFNHLTVNPSIDHMLAREIDELHRQRPQWERYYQFSKGLKWVGLWPAFSWYMAAGMDCGQGWFKEDDPDYDIRIPEALGRIGLPLTVDRMASCVTLLAGKTLRAFSREELEEIFRGNVFMDVYALKELQKMGIGEWAGVTAGDSHYSTVEVLNDHPFNGPFEGFSHNGIFQPSWELIPLREGVESLAYSRDGYDNCFGSCLIKYENEMGGKVVVSGYDCWRFIGDPHKLWQFRSIAKWMGCPLVLEWQEPLCVSRIQPFLRTDGKRAAILLINTSMDGSEPGEMVLAGSMSRAVSVSMDGSESSLLCTQKEDGLHIQLPGIKGWETAIVLAC